MRRLALTLLLAAAVPAAVSLPAAAPAAARLASPVSSPNWAGYAITGRPFRRVAGSWVVQPAHCGAGVDASEVTWVGLGGYRLRSRHVEQAGTSLECTAGRPRYHAWYELVPAPLRTVRLRVRPGDRIAASVTVAGTHVRVVLRNRTRHHHLVRHLRMANPDTSSAEWIAEAPTKCIVGTNSCPTAPLADFGFVSFARAAALTRHGHQGHILDAAWTTHPVVLQENSGSGASPGALVRGGRAFSVRYNAAAAAAASSRRVRTLPSTRVP